MHLSKGCTLAGVLAAKTNMFDIVDPKSKQFKEMLSSFHVGSEKEVLRMVFDYLVSYEIRVQIFQGWHCLRKDKNYRTPISNKGFVN